MFLKSTQLTNLSTTVQTNVHFLFWIRTLLCWWQWQLTASWFMQTAWRAWAYILINHCRWLWRQLSSCWIVAWLLRLLIVSYCHHYVLTVWGILTSFFIHLIYPLMFNPFAINTVQRTSAAVNTISTDLINAEVYVEYSNGETYVYTNVSRRAILNLLLQSNISLGFWVNHNLLYCDAKCATFGSCEHHAAFA